MKEIENLVLDDYFLISVKFMCHISDTLGCTLCATFLFLPHFDIICDLLLNRHTATWNLFVNYCL